MMTLETTRLLLRELEDSDWSAVHEYSTDSQVQRFLPGDAPTEQQTRETVRWMKAGPQDNPPRYEFAVILKSESRLIGWCAVRIRYDELRQGELAYAFHSAYWGKGYGTEAAAAALNFGFSQLDLHRLFATCRPANVGSWRVLEKIGMKREGHLRRHRWIRDSWQDSFLYAILEDEWRPERAGRTGTGNE